MLKVTHTTANAEHFTTKEQVEYAIKTVSQFFRAEWLLIAGRYYIQIMHQTQRTEQGNPLYLGYVEKGSL